jgi:hypothetical protein
LCCVDLSYMLDTTSPAVITASPGNPACFLGSKCTSCSSSGQFSRHATGDTGWEHDNAFFQQSPTIRGGKTSDAYSEMESPPTHSGDSPPLTSCVFGEPHAIYSLCQNLFLTVVVVSQPGPDPTSRRGSRQPLLASSHREY